MPSITHQGSKKRQNTGAPVLLSLSRNEPYPTTNKPEHAQNIHLHTVPIILHYLVCPVLFNQHIPHDQLILLCNNASKLLEHPTQLVDGGFDLTNSIIPCIEILLACCVKEYALSTSLDPYSTLRKVHSL